MIGKSPRYCYWSVATGHHAVRASQCIASARKAGVHKEFHILTDQAIPDCSCYEAPICDQPGGLFKLIFLKAGIKKLPFDWLIWVDADTFFAHEPRFVLDAIGRSPLHVPLEVAVDRLGEDKLIGDIPARDYLRLLRKGGVRGEVYSSRTAFWIIRREAIDVVVDLASQFGAMARAEGKQAGVDACLGYAMHMLCADVRGHERERRADLWSHDPSFDGSAIAGDSVATKSSIIHLSLSQRTASRN
jgi:hypothetical protein